MLYGFTRRPLARRRPRIEGLRSHAAIGACFLVAVSTLAARAAQAPPGRLPGTAVSMAVAGDLENELRMRAARGEPASSAELDNLLASSDPAQRIAAARSLVASGHPHAIVVLSRLALPDEPRALRLAAIDALGESEALPALAVLFEMSDSADRDVRQAVARAIARIGGPYAAARPANDLR